MTSAMTTLSGAAFEEAEALVILSHLTEHQRLTVIGYIGAHGLSAEDRVQDYIAARNAPTPLLEVIDIATTSDPTTLESIGRLASILLQMTIWAPRTKSDWLGVITAALGGGESAKAAATSYANQIEQIEGAIFGAFDVKRVSTSMPLISDAVKKAIASYAEAKVDSVAAENLRAGDILGVIARDRTVVLDEILDKQGIDRFLEGGGPGDYDDDDWGGPNPEEMSSEQLEAELEEFGGIGGCIRAIGLARGLERQELEAGGPDDDDDDDDDEIGGRAARRRRRRRRRARRAERRTKRQARRRKRGRPLLRGMRKLADRAKRLVMAAIKRPDILFKLAGTATGAAFGNPAALLGVPGLAGDAAKAFGPAILGRGGPSVDRGPTAMIAAAQRRRGGASHYARLAAAGRSGLGGIGDDVFEMGGDEDDFDDDGMGDEAEFGGSDAEDILMDALNDSDFDDEEAGGHEDLVEEIETGGETLADLVLGPASGDD